MKKIIALKVLENYRVWLRFDDGVESEVDFSGKPHAGVFAPWQDYAFFQRARVGDCGELIWDDQIDFCPDALWLRVTGQRPEDLHPNLNPPAVHA